MRFIKIFVVLFGICESVYCQQLLPFFNSEGVWGFIDYSGNEVIKPKFDSAFNFNQNLAAVKYNGKWGYIDSAEKFIIQPVYDQAFTFNNNRAIVMVEGKYGFIDKSGNMIVNPIYTNAYTFSDNLAIFKDNLQNYLVVDTNGNEKLSLEKNYCFEFLTEGISSCPYFSSGYLIVSSSRNKKDQLINSQGKVRDLNYEICSDGFSENIAIYFNENGYGYINTKMIPIIKAQYFKASTFLDGNAWVVDIDDNKYFLKKLSIRGKTLESIEIQLDTNKAITSIHNHKAMVIICVVDSEKQESIIIFSKKDMQFHDEIQGGWLFDFDRKFPVTLHFEKPIFFLKDENTYRYVNQDGKIIWSGRYK